MTLLGCVDMSGISTPSEYFGRFRKYKYFLNIAYSVKFDAFYNKLIIDRVFYFFSFYFEFFPSTHVMKTDTNINFALKNCLFLAIEIVL